MMLRARDETHVQGRMGLIMYRTRADYDNVIVSPNLQTTLLSDDFETRNDWWSLQGEGQWSVVTDGSSRVYQQSSVVGGTRSITGVDITDDQIVAARAKAIAFGSGAGRWFGLMARYQDSNNYYYLTLRNDNTVSLRKLVNGAIVVLDDAPLTVTANTWYALRLEAIGSSLRAYVNGRLLLEASDDAFAQGAYGIAMYKAATRVDDFRVVQP
jgi:pectate lyase